MPSSANQRKAPQYETLRSTAEQCKATSCNAQANHATTTSSAKRAATRRPPGAQLAGALRARGHTIHADAVFM
eukprot:5875429-Pyramimonas_sp.AAC.1